MPPSSLERDRALLCQCEAEVERAFLWSDITIAWACTAASHWRYICIRYKYVCLEEGRYQYIGMSWAKLVILHDIIEENQICLLHNPT